MRMITFLFSLSAVVFLTGFFGGGGKTDVSLVSNSGYSTKAYLYDGNAENKSLGIVFLHGKSGNPESAHNSKIIKKMHKSGYTVLAPLMPWSARRGYEGTHSDGMDIILEAINSLDTENVVVIGHSMGAAAALQFGASNSSDKLAGLIIIAQGHNPHMSRKIRELTEKSSSEACARMSAGNGKEKSSYPDRNKGKNSTINASAEYHCTFYSLDEYPDPAWIAQDINLPVLFISGINDRITTTYQHSAIFDTLPDTPHNKYLLLDGDHKSVLYEHTDEILDWMENLAL